jgi:pimeloyl-ACP methyl ester carboxylesterase
MRLGVLWKAGRALLGGPESSILDLPNLVRGFRSTFDAMWPEVSKLNLLKLVPALKMPVVILVGRQDHWVPPETSVAYFDALVAPSKQLVWFDHSGHEMFVDEPEKFNSTMVSWRDRSPRTVAVERKADYLSVPSSAESRSIPPVLARPA